MGVGGAGNNATGILFCCVIGDEPVDWIWGSSGGLVFFNR